MGQIAGVTCPLYYFRLRYYDPGQGRWISRDPSGIWVDLGQNGNGYGFVGANAINGLDPFGLQGPDVRRAEDLDYLGRGDAYRIYGPDGQFLANYYPSAGYAMWRDLDGSWHKVSKGWVQGWWIVNRGGFNPVASPPPANVQAEEGVDPSRIAFTEHALAVMTDVAKIEAESREIDGVVRATLIGPLFIKVGQQAPTVAEATAAGGATRAAYGGPFALAVTAALIVPRDNPLPREDPQPEPDALAKDPIPRVGKEAQVDDDPVLYRWVAGPETASRLERKAEAAVVGATNAGFPPLHGVSAWTFGSPAAPRASVKQIVAAGFVPVHSPWIHPSHWTIVLPCPMTKPDADRWNALWKLK